MFAAGCTVGPGVGCTGTSGTTTDLSRSKPLVAGLKLLSNLSLAFIPFGPYDLMTYLEADVTGGAAVGTGLTTSPPVAGSGTTVAAGCATLVGALDLLVGSYDVVACGPGATVVGAAGCMITVAGGVPAEGAIFPSSVPGTAGRRSPSCEEGSCAMVVGGCTECGYRPPTSCSSIVVVITGCPALSSATVTVVFGTCTSLRDPLVRLDGVLTTSTAS